MHTARQRSDSPARGPSPSVTVRGMTIAAFVVSIVAVVVAALAGWWAKVSAAAAVRSADAAEAALALEQERAAKYTAPWRLSWLKGDTYALLNDGDENVYGVEVDPGGLPWIKGEREHDVIHARAPITFMTTRGFTGGSDVITVTWHRTPDLSDDPHTWRHPLPLKG